MRRWSQRGVGMAARTAAVVACAVMAIAGGACEKKAKPVVSAGEAVSSGGVVGIAALTRTQRTSSGAAVLELTTTVDRTSLTVAERVDLRLEAVSGIGATVTMPKIEQTLGGFTVVSSQGEEVIRGGQRVSRLHVVLEPFLAGEKAIPALDVQAKEGSAVLSLKTEPVPVTVTPVAEADATAQTPLEPARAPVALVVAVKPNPKKHALMWFGGILAVAACGMLVGIVQVRRARHSLDAVAVVRRRLDAIRTVLKEGEDRRDAERAASDLHRALTKYLAAAWGIHSETQTLPMLAPALQVHPSLGAEARSHLIGLLTDMEQTRFAPDAASVPGVQRLVDRTAEFVEKFPPPPPEGRR